jgi:hypothetical protein
MRMNTKLLWPLGLTAALTAASAMPAFGDSGACSAPGITVVTDPAGDESVDTGEGAVVPVPDAAADILSLALSEPSGQLVFTYKMSDLSTVPPNHAWIVRFSTDVPPDNGDEDYFVAMVSAADGSTSFVYGTDGFTADAPAEPRQFRPIGDITGSFGADGTITLAVDKAKVPGLDATAVYGIKPTTRGVTGLNTGAEPFFTNGSDETILDQTDVPDDYTLGGCSGGKSGLLGLGALSPLALLVLGLLSVFGINKRRVI